MTHSYFRVGRALVFAFFTYVTSFLLGTVVQRFFSGGIPVDFSTAIPLRVWLIGLVFSILLSALFTFLYLRRRVLAHWKSGLFYGLAMVGMGIAIDAVTVSVIWSDDTMRTQIIDYYTNPWFGITMLAIVLTAAFVGHLRSRP